jgi:hypothetical protein
MLLRNLLSILTMADITVEAAAEDVAVTDARLDEEKRDEIQHTNAPTAKLILIQLKTAGRENYV